MKLCGRRPVAGWKLGRRIKLCIWSTNGSSSLIHLFFWCQFGDRDANNTYLSRIGFLWSNNNDFIAHYISHPFRPFSFVMPAAWCRCCEYSDCSKNETRGEKLFITACSMGFCSGVHSLLINSLVYTVSAIRVVAIIWLISTIFNLRSRPSLHQIWYLVTRAETLDYLVNWLKKHVHNLRPKCTNWYLFDHSNFIKINLRKT